jgi:hypothetical protein
MTTGGIHETVDHSLDGAIGSDKSFGAVFATFFVVVCLLPLASGGIPRWWALALATTILAVTLLRPRWLNPFNQVWFQFGKLLQWLVTPVILAAMYFAVFMPIALALRALGRDPLKLRFDQAATSYWIARTPGPAPDSFKNQF